MNPTILPNHFLEKMAPADRAKLGKAGRTRAECEAAFVAKSERDLQNQIANYLGLQGLPFCRPAMNRKSTIRTGWPDFTFCVDGLGCALEVKFGSYKPVAGQTDCMAEMRKSGWRVRVVYSLADAIFWVGVWRREAADIAHAALRANPALRLHPQAENEKETP